MTNLRNRNLRSRKLLAWLGWPPIRRRHHHPYTGHRGEVAAFGQPGVSLTRRRPCDPEPLIKLHLRRNRLARFPGAGAYLGFEYERDLDVPGHPGQVIKIIAHPAHPR